jgi:putative glutamine amidotransferase
MSRPLLGVSCCLRPGDAEPVHGVIDRYLRAPASHADADVVLVPALPGLTDWASLADRLDGLLLTGSPSNMEPWRYGGSQGDGPFDPRATPPRWRWATPCCAPASRCSASAGDSRN